MKILSKENRPSMVVVLLVGGCWLAMGAMDWGLRFSWFGWHHRLITKPYRAASTNSSEARSHQFPEQRGGDLSRLIGIPSVARLYEEVREAHTVYIDAFGYPNPGSTNETFDIVVTGDSYMATGGAWSNRFSGALSSVSGQPVYDHAIAGVGPNLSLIKYFASDWFKKKPPKVLIWGFIERDIKTELFTGSLLYELHKLKKAAGQGVSKTRIYWTALLPRNLKHALPDTSMISQIGYKLWNRTRYFVFGKINPDVIPIGNLHGRPSLFYYAAVDAMKRGRAWTDPVAIGIAIERLKDDLKQQGTDLVVVLIPNKEQTCRDYLPEHLNTSASPIPSSILWDIEKELGNREIITVNLLPPFKKAHDEGKGLYWTDDTHWNLSGIQLAAENVWSAINPLLLQKE